jgi:hypothetical protein
MLQREQIIAGTTSVLVRVFIANSSVTTGAGLTGLTYSSASLTAYYIRDGGTSTTAISLVTATVGTWVSGGFVEVDATHMPGIYEIGLPNAVVAAGVAKATLYLQGATNMQDTVLFIDIPTGDAYAALTTTTYAEPSSVPAATDTLLNKLNWIALLHRNLITNSTTNQQVFADNNSTVVGTAAVSDTGSTATRGKFA